jgi:hypothetical protein
MTRERKRVTPARRIVWVIAWTTFVLALVVRFVVLREDRQTSRRVKRVFWQQQQQEPRFRRPPILVRPPLSQVPKDLPRIQIEIAAEGVEVLSQNSVAALSPKGLGGVEL